MSQSIHSAWRERIAYGPSGGSGGGGNTTNTVTSSQAIPQFMQDQVQSNLDLANSIGSQPYPLYQGQLVAPFNPTQIAGQQAATDASLSYQPGLNAATAQTAGVAGAFDPATAQQNMASGAGAIGNAMGANQLSGLGAQTIGNALAGNNPGNANVISQYMSPFVQAALAPQITAMNTQLGMQQRGIDQQATSANAFGDARQGAQSALANFYGNQSLAGIEAQGFNTAFGNAQNVAQQQQQMGIGAGTALSNIGAQQQGIGIQGGNALSQLGLSQGQGGLQAGAQLGSLAQMQQSLGLGGANAINNVGQMQQQQTQQGLNTAYQQFLNQVRYPQDMLSLRESALTNQPYSRSDATTLPNANMTSQGLGAFASLAGMLGGGGGGGVFGGQPLNMATAHA